MLVNSRQIILAAQRGKYAIGAFNTSDLEITKAIINAAVKLNSPVIIQVSEKAIAYAGLENLVDIIKNEARYIKVPVVLHLDHAHNLEIIGKALTQGFTSVMYDGSALTLAENEIMTRHAAQMAHRHEATCEGELGSVGNSQREAFFTDPSLVKDYLKKTKVDTLAVAIGSRHATEIESLNLKLLDNIALKTRVPLVLHGASGVPEGEVKKAIKAGICKVNIDTDIRNTFDRSLKEAVRKHSELKDPRDIMTRIIKDIQTEVEKKIKLFGSDGKG